MNADRVTRPAPPCELEALALFEALIRDYGEDRARFANLAVKLGLDTSKESNQ